MYIVQSTESYRVVRSCTVSTELYGDRVVHCSGTELYGVVQSCTECTELSYRVVHSRTELYGVVRST